MGKRNNRGYFVTLAKQSKTKSKVAQVVFFLKTADFLIKEGTEEKNLVVTSDDEDELGEFV